MGQEVHLYVFNTNTQTIRLVTLTPNPRWGGEGSIGCDIGYGYLHRIPVGVLAQNPITSEQQLRQVQQVIHTHGPPLPQRSPGTPQPFTQINDTQFQHQSQFNPYPTSPFSTEIPTQPWYPIQNSPTPISLQNTPPQTRLQTTSPGEASPKTQPTNVEQSQETQL